MRFLVLAAVMFPNAAWPSEEALPKFDPEPAIAEFHREAEKEQDSSQRAWVIQTHRPSTPCDCQDGRIFKPEDSVVFTHSGMKIATLVYTDGCRMGVVEYEEFYATARGKAKKSPAPGHDFAFELCRLMKVEQRPSITKALRTDPTPFLKDGDAVEIPQESDTPGDQDPNPRRPPPESGNLLENMPKGAGLPGGFQAGDYAVVKKDARVKGIPKNTVGIVLGSSGKHGEKLRVGFRAYSNGKKILGFVVGMVIGRAGPYLIDHPKEITAIIDSDDLLGVWVPDPL